MSEDLLSKIRAIDVEVANMLSDGGVTNEDLKDLCYEALGELIPTQGIKGILLRSRIWKVISAETNAENATASSLPCTTTAVMTCPNKEFDQSSTSSVEPPAMKRPWLSHAKSPEYTIYQDTDVAFAAKSGTIPVELRHRIIRGTINNMVSVAYSPPWNRQPTNNEILEMAKSIIITYPPLKDAETKHGVVFKQLKKRLYNVKPPTKQETRKGKQGKKKVLKQSKIATPDDDVKVGDGDSNCSSEHSQKSQSPCQKSEANIDLEDSDDTLIIDDESDVDTDSPSIMLRHYNALIKECRKQKPSRQIINSYLNKEFLARRSWLKDTPAETRCSQLLSKYPCFNNHVEIIEEVRRILGEDEEDSPRRFMGLCVQRLHSEIDSIIYYGMSKKNTAPPTKPTTDAKITHMITNLSQIFSGKKAKKVADLLEILKDHEDPENWIARRSGNVPVLLLDATNSYIVVGRTILTTVEICKLDEALLAFLGVFYLLDFDYPKCHEIGLSVLQSLLLLDKETPADLLKTFESVMTDYSKFKSSE